MKNIANNSPVMQHRSRNTPEKPLNSDLQDVDFDENHMKNQHKVAQSIDMPRVFKNLDVRGSYTQQVAR